MPRKNFKCILSYKGTNYYGWQTQKELPTVQGLIEYALEKYFGFAVRTFGAGRTDAGVHAYGQVCNFFVDTKLEGESLKHILNNLLPDDIRIHSVNHVINDFNSRYNVKKKFYRYVIFNSNDEYPFNDEYAWKVKDKLNIDKMIECAESFKGEKNYYSFSKSGSDGSMFVRTINSVKITGKGKYIYIDFLAKGFLYQQIRKMTGFMVEYARGNVGKTELDNMFEVQDRTQFKDYAPPQGLFMVKIIYDRKYDV